MQFILPTYEILLAKQILTIEHDGLTLLWDISEYQIKSTFEKDNMHEHMFTHINAYWSRQTPTAQKNIFNCFVRIREAFNTPSTVDELNAQLYPLLEELYRYHPFADMEYFVRYISGIRIPGPEHLEAVFIENDDKNHTRNKTYTIDDYVGLVTLVLSLRLMVPIWGAYIKATGSVAGTKYKEYYALMLLDRASISMTEPFVKLGLYIQERTPKDGNKTAMIDFISSEEYPRWIMALLMVRKLCLTDIRGAVDQSAVLVRHISRHVHERVNRTDTSFGGKINPKTDSTIRGTEENQISFLEGNKVKQKLSKGQIETLRFYVNDPYEVAKRLDSTLPLVEVEKALQMQSVLQERKVGIKAQVMLLQWMIPPVVPPQATDFFSIVTVSQLLCVVHAVLWHNGHHLMAGLATATVNNQNNNIITTSETGTKGRLTKEILDEFATIYPYQRRTRAGRLINTPVQAVDNMVTEFAPHPWSLTLSQEKLEILNPNSTQPRMLILPHNFRTKVAELALYTAKRPRPTSLLNGI